MRTAFLCRLLLLPPSSSCSLAFSNSPTSNSRRGHIRLSGISHLVATPAVPFFIFDGVLGPLQSLAFKPSVSVRMVCSRIGPVCRLPALDDAPRTRSTKPNRPLGLLHGLRPAATILAFPSTESRLGLFQLVLRGAGRRYHLGRYRGDRWLALGALFLFPSSAHLHRGPVA